MASSQASNHEQATDEQLVRLSLDGDESAFSALLTRYRLTLYHFLARFVGSRSAAEDLFQESFMQVFQSLERFDEKKTFKPWLFTIAANKARDYLRKHKRQRPMPLSAPVDGPGGTGRSMVDLLEADLPAPPAALEQAELKERVRLVIDSMPDHLREVLLLAYFNQFAYAEIADMLSIPLGTVKSRLHSAVASFAKQWKSSADKA